MKKIALFVEGQTELIFVKNLLLTVYTYNVDITCYKLRAEGNKSSTNYDYKCEDSGVHYQLIDVGNDTAVLQRMLDREKGLIGAGYSIIIGLRDMYGREYSEYTQEINIDVIRKFIGAAKTTISTRASSPEKLRFCFAIMEVEAWFIGLKPFSKLHEDLNDNNVSALIGCDLASVNSEMEFYRPSSVLKEIYSSVQLDYDKSEKAVESLCSHFALEDYLKLTKSDTCRSFSYFYNKIFSI